MSKGVYTFGRFNAPTETGHGKLIDAVQAHAEEVGARHYIFPSHSQDAKKNPLEHSEKVRFMRRLFPNANIVSNSRVRTAIDAAKYLEKQGHTHVTMVVGSDRVEDFNSLLNKYRKKEFPGVKKVNVISAGNRDPDAEGAEGMSASKLRKLVAAGKRKEFISHYSDPKLGAEIYDRIKAGMQMESTQPIGIFLIGGPGSGKDYVLNNIFSRFDLTEVQVDHLLNGSADELIESKKNIIINGALDEEKINSVKALLEDYSFDHVYVAVTNKVSRLRNSLRDNPLAESKRLEKWYRAEKLAEQLNCFVFNNSLNLNESSEFEKVFFASQIEKLLQRITTTGLSLQEEVNLKTFTVVREGVSKYVRRVPRSGGVTEIERKRAASRAAMRDEPQLEEKKFPPVAKDKESGLPKKYVAGLSTSTAKARKAHWNKMSKLSDRDPRAYAPAPGDATAKTKPSKHTLAVRRMMDEQIEGQLKVPHTVENIAKKHNVSVDEINKALERGIKVEMEHTKDKETAQVIALAHLWEKPDYYKLLAKMEQVHFDDDKARKLERRGRIRDRLLHHQNAQIHRAMMGEETIEESDSSLAAKAAKSGISVSTLRKVYKRGVAAWNSGHRPGTTPQQWGHARVNSYINKGKTYHTADKDLREETEDLDSLFEMQLVGTDEYRKHAIAMTPGQSQEIENAFDALSKPKKKTAEPVKEESCDCDCGDESSNEEISSDRVGVSEGVRKFNQFRAELKEAKKEEKSGVDFTPTLSKKTGLRSKLKAPNREYRSTMDGLPVTSRLSLGITEETSELTLEEAVQYHIENKISFTENIFRPGSDMFFDMINEAKRLYKEGKYEPTDEYEVDMLNSEIGEKAIYEGQEVILDFPFEEELNEEDKTDGKGIGKPWREGGGGAVYVRTGDGGIKKVRFSQSGMKKKFMDPAATRSFVARHRCLTNKDKTSASYWACRYPRFFSNSGKIWW